MDLDLLVAGGLVVDPNTGLQALDLGVKDGKFAAILQPGSGAKAKETVDARGKLVFPGFIDAHVHFGFGEPVTEYTTETIYAAQGGFSSILAFFLSSEPYGAVYERELVLAKERSFVDFAFHFATANEKHVDELDEYVRKYGVTSFKYWMNFKGEEGRYMGIDGTDDGYMYDLLKKSASIGDVTMVIHTENIEIVNRLRRGAMSTGMNNLKDWAATKPPFTEAESTLRAMYFAESVGAKIYIPHLSTRMALDEVRRWRDRYDNIFVETCPHYLTHDEDSDLEGLGKANPPFRSKDDVEAMWEGLADGSIDTVASDHVPRKKATKEKPLWQASQGFPGTATIFPVLMSEGYHKGRLSLERICELISRAPADIFGLPQKGRIEIGADADLAVVDPDFVREVKWQELGSFSDYSLYDGWTFKGWPRQTILRGQTIMKDGQITGQGGYGQFLARVP